MKGKKRHDFLYRTLWMLLRHIFIRKFNFKHDLINVEKKPYIVISNHITNWDPILIGLSFGRNMYYVATDQILRMGLKSKLLMFAFSPIARAKTVNETQTVIEIFKRLRDKCNICIFVEGDSTYDGETCEIQPSTGKLIKRAGVTLVTYRFTGSYLMFPRWGRFKRKGVMEGRLVNIYSPEKIASMSENEIYETIKNDINVSAYADQEKNPIAYRGKKIAECLETVLYCCPKCRKFATMTSCDDLLTCTCGLQVRYNEYGYFEAVQSDSEQPPFKTVTEWIKWERKEIEALAASVNNSDSNEPVFSDDNQQLFEVTRASHNTFIANGKFSFYKDRLSFAADTGQTFDFPFEKINEMSGFAMMRIIFSTKDHKIYEVFSKYPRSALKYLDIYKAVKLSAKE